MAPELLILAAGMGSRYGGLKQLEIVGPSGETLLDYSVLDAIRAGFERVVFVIRRDFGRSFANESAGATSGGSMWITCSSRWMMCRPDMRCLRRAASR